MSRGDTPDGKEEKIMRVTKIIREYVEKTVTNALPFGAPKDEYIAADRELNDLRDRLEEQVDAYNRTAVVYKRIAKLKVRHTEFPKNTLRKIKRFELDTTID